MENENKNKNKISRLFARKHMMSIISTITLLILIVPASVAWFALQRSGIVEGIGAKVSEWDFIVSLESMGEPLENDQTVDILANSIKTNDIGKGKLAPGSYGSIDLYIRNSSDVASDFLLTIDNKNLVIDVDKNESDYTSKELTNYLHSHLRFYADKNYTKEVNMNNPIEGELTIGKEKKVTVYWVWHYDGEFLCTENMTDKEKKRIMDKYDEEDVIISEHREHIVGSIRIAVAGTQKEPKEN